MAIEKTVFTKPLGDDRSSEIATWLRANATEFFNKIEEVVINNSPHVYCYTDDIRTADFYAGGSNAAGSVSIKNGKYKATNTADWQYGIKTSKGIALRNAGGCCYAICKTNKDTVSVALRENNATYVCADVDNSPDFVTFGAPTKNQYGWMRSSKTVLTPIANANTLTYADGLYLQVFSQYPNVEGIISVNGKQYYTDGVFALEE